MDMSVKLNLSYPAARSAEPVSDKPASGAVEGTAAFADKVPESKASPDAEKVRSAVSEIEKFLSSSRRNLEFSTDEESGKVVVKVIASDTGELIRQLPSEEALRIANSLNDVNSVLFDAKA
ncbi:MULTISPECIES: flagellar protein FlaG [Pseudomonas]|uniref:flagellar protein FlaG n=1 Tax=Pseudomonas TaxID=286 RepID=UPI0013DEF9AE|nr:MULTISPECIES: flagellar protein FlaG [Pseudomonas]MCE0911099.1 flagellar protein FlaG [Pseudomonas kurunegalensis]QIG19883.1 flagellar protein FlaG [Pseudomonas monteilii]QIG25135.1 flagellar protein FlaG [Pseudomonas monteilii]WJR54591.1 flagellar protein FlaG [Pseudomonas kurunegalensis]